jgi:hypothetical protein
MIMAEAEFVKIGQEENDLSQPDTTREAWTTPLVIASALRAAKAHVGHGHDGTSPQYGPYGS